jgi:hypothetical protein
MFWGVPHGIQGRSTLAEDTPGAIRYGEYVSSAGVNTHEPQVMVRLFNDTAAACVKSAIYMVDYDGDEEENPKVIAIAADAAGGGRWVVVATEATADQAWGWFVIFGYVDALVEGTGDVAKDDYLKTTAATSTTGFVVDGTARTVDSFAMATEAQADAGEIAIKVYLLGQRADVD